MINFKKHLNVLKLILYIVGFLALLLISLTIIGRQRIEIYFSDGIVEILDYVRLIIDLIVSVFFLFMVFLSIFHKISLKSVEGFVVVKEKDMEYYVNIFIFLVGGLILFYLFITKLIRFL